MARGLNLWHYFGYITTEKLGVTFDFSTLSFIIALRQSLQFVTFLLQLSHRTDWKIFLAGQAQLNGAILNVLDNHGWLNLKIIIIFLIIVILTFGPANNLPSAIMSLKNLNTLI